MPVGGLMTSIPEDQLEDRHTPRCVNVRFRFGEVIPRPGSALFSNKQAVEEVREITEFIDPTPDAWILHFLQTKLYRWGNSAPGTPRDWFQVTGGPSITANRRWSLTAGEGRLFFTNDADVLTWAGTGTYSDITDADTSGIFVTEKVDARYIEYFNNRLMLGYVNEASGVKPVRVRWPRNGDYTRWDDTLGLGAGFLDLFEEGEEDITGLKAIQDRLAVYKKQAIIDIVPTGQVTPTFIVQTRARGVGCAAPYTLASNGFSHFFMGHDVNVYEWNGTQLQGIGDSILDELEGLVDPSRFNTIFGKVLPSLQEYWLVVDSENVFIFDYVRRTWSRYSYPSLTAIGEANDTIDSFIWSTIPGTWETHPESWQNTLGARKLRVFGGRATGEIFEIDKNVAYDYFAIGSIVDRYIETPDFYFVETETGQPSAWRQGTVQQLLLIYQYVNAEPFEVGLSFDRGVSWTTQSVVPNTSGYSVVHFNMTGNVVRYRFRENNANGFFRWRSYDYEFVDAGPFRP